MRPVVGNVLCTDFTKVDNSKPVLLKVNGQTAFEFVFDSTGAMTTLISYQSKNASQSWASVERPIAALV